MNVKNRTLFIADNLDIMKGMDSEIIDLIYLDPPFNTKKQYKAPIGSPAEGAEFKDIWTDEDVKDGWYSEIAELYPNIHQVIQAAEHTYDHSMMIYLMAMGIRLIEMQRLLKPTGSIYLHCDPTASHYLKLVMDDIFGKNNFRNEIVWQRIKGAGKTTQHKAISYGTSTDQIFFYAFSDSKFDIDSDSVPFSEKYLKSFKYEDEKGVYTRRSPFNSKGQEPRPNQCYEYKGFFPPHPSGWNVTLETLTKMDEDGELEFVNEKVYRKHRLKKGKRPDNLWLDIGTVLGNEKTGYPTQKPLTLLQRIIKASSNENDVVLDPFCGCATACVAAEKLQRQWIGIDISPSAEVITKLRLDAASEQGQLFSPIQMSDVTVTSDPPIRTDSSEPRQPRLPMYTVHKNDLYGKQEGFCNGCRDHLKMRHLEVDHIIPDSKGGTDHPANLQLLCSNCNSIKGNRTQEYLIERLKAQNII